MKIERLFFAGVVLVFCLLTASSAWGHKVHVFAWVEKGTVHTESYFSDGNKVVNAQIQAFDNYGKLIMSGKTDKKGIFTFKLPECTHLRIVLNASEGHNAEFDLAVDQAEIKQSATPKPLTPEPLNPKP
ncbi:MAG: carboxypeptidase regulatory-like domain-containing protein [Deltaproteobacteria bacterium]|nr:carboxypeptidase regulatory-like domain-containing protein [Deltaproteobacteria bacterium]